jgi:type IV pilus assembly protein PilY1
LKDSLGGVQPITTRPELGEIDGTRWVYVGTGKYLENADLSNSQQQTLYAFPDNGALVDNPRNNLQEQELTKSGSTRTAAAKGTGAGGWFVNLADTKERQHVNARLIAGTLVVPTSVPEASECTPGGYGYLNYFDYKTGQGPVGANVSTLTNAPVVGFNYIYINGKPVISVVTSDKPTPEIVNGAGFKPTGSGFAGKRAVWRELIPQ